MNRGSEHVDKEAATSALVDLAGALVDDFDVAEVLQLLTDRCVSVLEVDASGVLLADQEGELRIAASSSERAQLLELFQLQSGQGPCLECYRTGSPVSVDDLGAADGRWPRFAPAARAAGYHSVHALPMRLHGNAIGGLNLFGADGHEELSPDHLRWARALADVATITIVQGRAVRRHEAVTEQLQTALHSRVVIEQAKGLIAGRLEVELERAFDLLRSRARRTNRRLSELAHDVTAGRIEPEAIAGEP